MSGARWKPGQREKERLARGMLLAAALLLSGCASLGPQRLGIDRSHYTEKLRESSKEELLLNVVALRHGDPPQFLQVSSVISQYTREGSVGAGLTINPASDSDSGGVSGEVLLRETPTITYAPLTGERFARSILGPLSPAALLGMIESGWPPDRLFRITARSINGVRNTTQSPLFQGQPDPKFEPLMQAFGRLHASAALAFHVHHQEKGGFELTAQRSETLSEQNRADIALIGRMLQLDEDAGKAITIGFGPVSTGGRQVSISTRSMFEIFAETAQGVDNEAAAPLIRIRSGGAAPRDAHVSVKYRGRSYWIDGDDRQSIGNFLVIQMLLTLTDSGNGANAPLVTIPAG